MMSIGMWGGCRRSHRGSHRARGSAVVEFAVVLPLLLTILFGIIEYGWVFMVRQTLQQAAREGCRMAVLQTSDYPYPEAQVRIGEVMSSTGLTYTYSATPPTGPDSIVTIDLSVPYDDVSLMGDYFPIHPSELTGNCSMRKEGTGS